MDGESGPAISGSLDRYDAVAEAFLTGMERTHDAGATCPGPRRWRRSSSRGWIPRSTGGLTGWAASGPPRCTGARGIRRHSVRRAPGRPGRGQHHAGGETERCHRARRGSGRQYPRHLWRSVQKLEKLAVLGVDYTDVVQVLENEDMEKLTPAGMGWLRNSRPARTYLTAAGPKAQTAAERRRDGAIQRS